jgi:hypothetical protein
MALYEKPKGNNHTVQGKAESSSPKTRSNTGYPHSPLLFYKVLEVFERAIRQRRH